MPLTWTSLPLSAGRLVEMDPSTRIFRIVSFTRNSSGGNKNTIVWFNKGGRGWCQSDAISNIFFSFCFGSEQHGTEPRARSEKRSRVPTKLNGLLFIFVSRAVVTGGGKRSWEKVRKREGKKKKKKKKKKKRERGYHLLLCKKEKDKRRPNIRLKRTGSNKLQLDPIPTRRDKN